MPFVTVGLCESCVYRGIAGARVYPGVAIPFGGCWRGLRALSVIAWFLHGEPDAGEPAALLLWPQNDGAPSRDATPKAGTGAP